MSKRDEDLWSRGEERGGERREERDWGGERREIGVERVERLRWRAES